MSVIKQSKFILILFIDLVLLTVILNSIGNISMLISKQIYPKIIFLDKENAFLVITIHHIIQALIGLGIIGIIIKGFKIKPSDFGFTKELFKKSMKPVIIYLLIFSLIQFIGTLIYVYGFNKVLYLNYKLSVYNFIGYFLFEVLLSGTSEEILFRALVIVIVGLSFRKLDIQHRNIKIASIIISSIVFTVCHIGFSLNPFKITSGVCIIP